MEEIPLGNVTNLIRIFNVPRTPSQQRHLINVDSFDQTSTTASALDKPTKDQIINQPHFSNEDSKKGLEPIIHASIPLPSAPPLGNYILS